MNTSVYFDIETGPLPDAVLKSILPPFDPAEVKLGNVKDPEKIKAKLESAEANYFSDARDKAALTPLHGKVLAIGAETGGEPIIFAHDGERETLETFWLFFKSTTGYFIGFNIFNFDLPFLVKRSWALGVSVPTVRKGRYWSDRFIDLRDDWQMGDRQSKGSLDVICRHFGIEGKNGSGKDFARMFDLNREKAIQYLVNDLRMTRQVHEIMEGRLAV